jgi:phage-related baseplate assembly protein
MSRFTAIDLSTLPPPTVVEAIDVDAIVAARKADIVARLTDVDADLAAEVEAILTLDSEPMVKIQQTGAYRETLHYARVNAAARSVMVAFAVGEDLDHLAAFYGVERMDGESDKRLRHRVALAPEAFSTCGPEGAYRYHVLSTDVSIKSVGIAKPEPGVVSIAFLVEDGGSGIPGDDVIDAVTARLSDENVGLLTDVVNVYAPSIQVEPVSLSLNIASGPDSETVRLASEAKVREYLNSRHEVGATIYASALDAAAHVPGVESVTRIAPLGDRIAPSLGAIYVESLSVVIQ